MSPDEAHAKLTTSGYVRSADGIYTHASRFRDQRGNPVVQKQQNADCEIPERQSVGPTAVDNQAGISESDGANNLQHRCTITVRFSNHRRTDLSGKLDTILDCLVHARRRLLGEDTGNRDKGGTVRKGKRRLHNPDREDFVKKPPF